jgi:hypothetical protein
MPERSHGPSYRDELAAAYERIHQLEARTRELESALADRSETALAEHLRDLDATLRRWDRIRATLALLLGFTGLFALRIADGWGVRVALLATCLAMVAVGITLAWPKVVRARVDPKPHALDVSRGWRRAAKRAAALGAAQPAPATGVRVHATGPEETGAHDAIEVARSGRDAAEGRQG